jgi:D-aminopeptidase
MIVVATDAPLDARQLGRLASRTPFGLARVGGYASHGSGDYAIAFTTHPDCRVRQQGGGIRSSPAVSEERLSPLMLAVVEATEEAVLNSLFAATTVTGRDGRTVEALPVDRVLELLRSRGALSEPR